MVGTYDYWLVLLSVVVAITASYVALDMASRVAAHGRKSRPYWLAGGAISMGTGIWSMHFIGMLAFHLPIPVSYDIPITLLSLLIAIVASGFALVWVSFGTMGIGRLAGGGLLMGVAIVSMHYTGMAAMRMEPPIQYQPFVVGLSALVAVAASVIALWSAFRLRMETMTTAFWKKAGSAFVMGTAIYGMHYIAMAAAMFAPNSVCTVDPQYINSAGLAGTLGGFALLLLPATLLVSTFDAYLAERSAEHAQALRQAHDTLEARVAERTAELARTNESLHEQIAERKEGEDRIRESEARLQAFMDNSPSVMFIKDLEGRYLHVNKQFTRSFGLDRRNVLLRIAAEIFPPDLAAKLEATEARVLATGTQIEAEEIISLVDGVHTHIVCEFPIADARGQITAIGGIRTDITERERAEREIRTSREQLRALASRLNAVREEERTSIALNIHDELGQALTSVKIDLSLLEQVVKSRKGQSSSAHTLRELRSAKRTIDKALDGVRRIAAELRPAVLNELGLGAAIEWLGKDFEKRTRIKCKVVLSTRFSEPDQERSTALYRVLQEALTNVARHATAKTVEIELEEDGGKYVLQVRDDGVGIPDHRLKDWRSLGLNGMRERMLMFGGQTLIERGAGGGTVVTASIPRDAKTSAAASIG
jgi:PAS domain S-box-containing protein